jgi:hypothetical protein
VSDAIYELGPHQQVSLGRAALRVRATSTTRTAARVDVAGTTGPVQRISAGDLVVLPVPGQVHITVAPTSGVTFAEGRVGLSLVTEGAGPRHQIEIRETDVAAMSSARLATIDIGDGIVVTATGPQQAPAWLDAGVRALRQSGVPETDQCPPSPWGLVIDGSASMLHLQRSGQLLELLRVVCGALYGWSGQLPSCATLTAPGADRDVTAVFTSPDPSFSTLTDTVPAPWSRLAPSIAAAGRQADLVVVLTDGVPVDVGAVAAAATTSKTKIVLVSTGLSRFAVSGWSGEDWREELAGLQPLADVPNARVIAVAVHPTSTGPRLVLDRADLIATALVVRRWRDEVAW